MKKKLVIDILIQSKCMDIKNAFDVFLSRQNGDFFFGETDKNELYGKFTSSPNLDKIIIADVFLLCYSMHDKSTLLFFDQVIDEDRRLNERAQFLLIGFEINDGETDQQCHVDQEYEDQFWNNHCDYIQNRIHVDAKDPKCMYKVIEALLRALIKPLHEKPEKPEPKPDNVDSVDSSEDIEL